MEESIWECLDMETQAELSQGPRMNEEELDMDSSDEMSPSFGNLVTNLRSVENVVERGRILLQLAPE
jgi:hypothetical protein